MSAVGHAANSFQVQSLARELGPQGVHCFYVIVDGSIGGRSGDSGESESKLDPDAIAQAFWTTASQVRLRKVTASLTLFLVSPTYLPCQFGHI